MKNVLTRIALTFVVALCAPSFVFAGYEITQSQTGMHGLSQSKIFIQNNKYMVSQPESNMLVDFANDKLIITNENNKTYWQGTTQQYINAMKDMREASIKRMQEMLKKFPESQRQEIMAIHGLDNKKANINVSIQKTGKIEVIAGYKAEQYIVNNNGEPYEELWIAKALDLKKEINPEKLQVFLARLKKSTMGGQTQGEIGLTKAYLNLFNTGYPVKQIFENNMMSITVDSVRKTHIPPKIFQLPEGYKKIESLQSFFMSGHGMDLKMQ